MVHAKTVIRLSEKRRLKLNYNLFPPICQFPLYYFKILRNYKDFFMLDCRSELQYNLPKYVSDLQPHYQR